MATLADLADAVAAEHTVVESVVALLAGIKAALDDAIAANDPAAIQAVADSIAADTKELSDAVVANTPA